MCVNVCVFLQKCKEEERLRGEEEIRQTEERRAKELYISLKQEEKRSERDDKEWQEQCAARKIANRHTHPLVKLGEQMMLDIQYSERDREGLQFLKWLFCFFQ